MNKVIGINDIRVEHVITKDDNYNNTIPYPKVVDSGFKRKLKRFLAQSCDGCKLPLWKTDEVLYMLKVAKKFMMHKILNNMAH